MMLVDDVSLTCGKAVFKVAVFFQKVFCEIRDLLSAWP